MNGSCVMKDMELITMLYVMPYRRFNTQLTQRINTSIVVISVMSGILQDDS